MTFFKGKEMKDVRILAGALICASLIMGGCPSDDDDDETAGTMPTTATMSTTVGMTDTDASGTDATMTGSTTGDSEDSMGSSESGMVMTDLTSEDMQAIFDEHCTAMCHEEGAMGAAPWPTLPLTEGVSYGNIVDQDGIPTMAFEDVKLVVPGDPDNSYLLAKLKGTQMDLVGEAGQGQMPLDRVDPTMSNPLDEATIAMVEEWIAGGAPE